MAVIDSGVDYLHPDLANKMWDGSHCVSDTGATLGGCIHGYDFVDDSKNPLPTIEPHGTHVSGIIAAQINSGTGIVGVNPNVKIMALRVGDHYMTESVIVRAINFARENGAKVINASFGGGYPSQIEYDTIKAFTDSGGLFIAAAGNNASNNNTTLFYPADYATTTTFSGVTYPANANVISVAATDENDQLASFSNYGNTSVDVAAPGVDIYSSVFSPAYAIYD